VNKAEIAALAQSASLSVEDFEKKYVRQVGVRKSLKEFPNGDCVFFDHETRRCQAYELRPRQCRTWPFWGSNLATPEAWKATCRDCPGAGTGPLVTLEEIQASAAKINI
jgi:Fe-S-cluster containining protein